MSNSNNIAVRPLEYDTGMVFVPGVSNLDEAKHVLKFFMQSVLDGHIPFTKVIGFKFSTDHGSNLHQRNSRISKFVSCGYTLESIPEVANNMASMIVLNWDESQYMCAYKLLTPSTLSMEKGAIPFVTRRFKEIGDAPQLLGDGARIQGPEQVQFLEEGVTLFHAVNPSVRMDIIVRKDSGYHDMDDTSKVKWLNEDMLSLNSGTESDYFFMNVNYSLNDFVRIIPPMNINDIFMPERHAVGIKVNFYRGMTFDIFSKMWDDMFTHESTRKWARSI